jgi:asparagine synthase (glutamine-hydrolysing)
MSGIAGIIGSGPVPMDVVRRMSLAQAHRGGEESIIELPHAVLAMRSHSASGIGQLVHGAAGRRVAAVMDGQLYNRAELLKDLAIDAGDADDSKLLAALWETRDGERLGDLRGQFAVAVWDEAKRQLFLARDHFGICPLHWSQQGEWLLFASEIKALLASGLVEKQVDLRGIQHVWTFFGTPGPATCFQGVSALPPGHCLEARWGPHDGAPRVRTHEYWRMDFPDEGHEANGRSEADLLDEYSSILQRSVSQRLGDSSSTVMYSSGGLDSSLLLSMGAKGRQQTINTYTFNIKHPDLDESALATSIGQYTGSSQNVVELTGRNLIDAFPRLVRSAESPVIDVSASALLQLAERVHADHHTTVVTGEGADELQAGYPWFRIRQRLDRLDRITRLPLSRPGFRSYLRWVQRSPLPFSFVRRSEALIGPGNAWLLAYSLMAGTMHRLFNREMLAAIGDHNPFEDLSLNQHGLRRWNSINRSIYLGTRIHLPGLHLAARGDRAAGRSGVETRYPFLDRDVWDFLAPLAPQWKIRGLTDKYLQRQLAKRWLPDCITAGNKSLLHAPLDALHRAERPAWCEQLLSRESLQKTPYFNPDAVRRWMAEFPTMRSGFRRLFIEMGLVGVISTQLWHHSYIDPTLAELDPA